MLNDSVKPCYLISSSQKKKKAVYDNKFAN